MTIFTMTKGIIEPILITLLETIPVLKTLFKLQSILHMGITAGV
jgi:hypothetical protein